MRILTAALGLTLLIGLAACNRSDQERAKEQARKDGQKISEEAKKATQDIKKDASELSHKVDGAIRPNGESASERMDHAEDKAKNAASHAGVDLDHAVLLAKVKAKLASDAGLATLNNVEVGVNGSVVTLTGTVANEDQKKEAEIAALHVEGVTVVRDRLAVTQ